MNEVRVIMTREEAWLWVCDQQAHNDNNTPQLKAVWRACLKTVNELFGLYA